jgi:hypothetical protein
MRLHRPTRRNVPDLRPAPALHPVLALILGLGLLACASTASRPAPFRARPDSVEPGSLLGPFSGRVFDAANRSPVAGALVYATWSLQATAGPSAAVPAGAREFVGSTNAAGRYDIPALSHLPRGVRVVDFTLLVYRRGFIAYRSDRRFHDFGTRLDFAQEGHQIVLERWRSELSHARHLRYIGGGSSVATVTGWEAEEAAGELSGERPAGRGELRPRGPGRGPVLVAAQLLTDADIKARTKYDGGFETGPLSDEPDTGTYSSQHFKALGRAETWDVALRMWRLDAGAAQTQYEELLGQLPGVTEKDEIASRSLRASEGTIRGVAFLDGPRGVVVLLTCGVSQCGSDDDAVALAQIIHDRLSAISPDATGGPAPADPDAGGTSP